MASRQQRKGISPLVAVIMLIAFTLVIAGILASWATQFAQTQRQSIQECSEAKALIYSANYEVNASTLNLVVYNNGKTDLDFTVIVTDTNGTIYKYPSDISTKAGEIKTTALTNIPSTLSEITIQGQKCQGAQDFLRAIDIKGLGA